MAGRKRYYYLLLGFSVLNWSCNDEETFPAPFASFSVRTETNGPLEAGIQVLFVNESINAAEYHWDFANGQLISTEVSPTVTFLSKGSFPVTLTAIQEDGQESIITEVLKVKNRVLKSISINAVNLKNPNGDTWDPITVLDPTGAPDPVVYLQNKSGTKAVGTFAHFNYSEPLTLIPIGTTPLTLTSEAWELYLFDEDDFNLETLDELMFVLPDFNPVDWQIGGMDETGTGVLIFDLEGNSIHLNYQIE